MVKAVDEVSFELEEGEVLGIVGESGSGKSAAAYSIMRLVADPGRVVAGRVLFDGQDLLTLDERQMRAFRGNRIAMVFQDFTAALNPVLRIDTQLIEAILAHRRISHRQARREAREVLTKVGIAAPDDRLAAYPHQFSGGMRQRVAIAIAILHRPAVIIADEPTTGLDVTVQSQILFEMQKLCRENRTAVIWITHDLGVVAGLADRICVMYAGKIVEEGLVDEVLDFPLHPYTAGLISSVPKLTTRREKLSQIPGTVPSLLDLPKGCAFRSRCSRASSKCHSMPTLVQRSDRAVRCFHPLTGGGRDEPTF